MSPKITHDNGGTRWNNLFEFIGVRVSPSFPNKLIRLASKITESPIQNLQLKYKTVRRIQSENQYKQIMRSIYIHLSWIASPFWVQLYFEDDCYKSI